jgi:hypothetical protein
VMSWRVVLDNQETLTTEAGPTIAGDGEHNTQVLPNVGASTAVALEAELRLPAKAAGDSELGNHRRPGGLAWAAVVGAIQPVHLAVGIAHALRHTPAPECVRAAERPKVLGEATAVSL